MEIIAADVDGLHLLVGDFDAVRIGAGVEFSVDLETGRRRRRSTPCHLSVDGEGELTARISM